MHSTRNAPRNKGPKFLDTKVLIASLSVAVTFGMWNLLSNDAVRAEQLAPTPAVTLPPQPPPDMAVDLPPIPTLVPIVEVSVQNQGNTVQVIQAEAPAAETTGKLRSVAAPTVKVVQKFKPVVAESVSAGGGGGGGGGAARTRSSKK